MIPTNYRSYNAFFNQSGEDAPTVEVVNNELGGEVVWTRDDIGSYLGTLAGAFAGRVVAFDSPGGLGGGGFPRCLVLKVNNNTINLIVEDLSAGIVHPEDGLLENMYVEIRVY